MMKLAYSANAYMRFAVLESIRRIAGLGYAGVEIMADRPHAWPPDVSADDAEAIRRAVADAGLTISNVNAFMMNAVQDFWHPSWIEPDPDFRRLRVEHTRASLSLAASLGAACITTEPGGPLPPGQGRDAAMRMFIAGLEEVLAHAESVGVMLLVEPEPGLLIESAAQFRALAGDLRSPMFGLNFDVGHFYCVRDPLEETIAEMAGWTRHYHVEDIPADREHRHLVPGHGAIDFDAVLRAIERTGYDGWLTVELYPYLDDPDGAGREALSFLQACMARTAR